MPSGWCPGEKREGGLELLRRLMGEVHVVFNDFPGLEKEYPFVEVENAAGRSINFGESHQRTDRFVELVFTELLPAG